MHSEADGCVRKFTTHFRSLLVYPICICSAVLLPCICSAQEDTAESFKKQKENPDKYNAPLGTSILVDRLIVLPVEMASFALYVHVMLSAILLWKQAHRL